MTCLAPCKRYERVQGYHWAQCLGNIKTRGFLGRDFMYHLIRSTIGASKRVIVVVPRCPGWKRTLPREEYTRYNLQLNLLLLRPLSRSRQWGRGQPAVITHVANSMCLPNRRNNSRRQSFRRPTVGHHQLGKGYNEGPHHHMHRVS